LYCGIDRLDIKITYLDYRWAKTIISYKKYKKVKKKLKKISSQNVPTLSYYHYLYDLITAVPGPIAHPRTKFERNRTIRGKVIAI